MKIGCNLHKVSVLKANGMVAFGHVLSGSSALSSLSRVCSSSSEYLLPCECAKWSRVDDDDDSDIESASCEIVPGVNHNYVVMVTYIEMVGVYLMLINNHAVMIILYTH